MLVIVETLKLEANPGLAVSSLFYNGPHSRCSAAEDQPETEK